jgi:hypothetical protein
MTSSPAPAAITTFPPSVSGRTAGDTEIHTATAKLTRLATFETLAYPPPAVVTLQA